MSELARGPWRKASRSNASGGECVEVAADGRVAVRDSKNPDRAHLAFGRSAWLAFTRGVKAGSGPA